MVDSRTIILLLLPVALILINFVVGLSQKWSDFTELKENSRPVYFSLALQFLFMPLVAIALSLLFQLEAGYAIGMILLACSPGSPVATLYSHLAKGNAALNVVLTGFNAMIGAVFVPVMVYVSYRFYYGAEKEIPMDLGRMFVLICLLLIPLIVGMHVFKKYPAWTEKYRGLFGKISWAYLLVLVLMALAKDYALIGQGFLKVGHVALIFALIAFGAGYGLARIIRLDRAQSISVMMELGLHNVSMILTIAVAPDLLNSVEVALPSAVYTFYMHVIANLLVLFFKRRD